MCVAVAGYSREEPNACGPYSLMHVSWLKRLRVYWMFEGYEVLQVHGHGPRVPIFWREGRQLTPLR